MYGLMDIPFRCDQKDWKCKHLLNFIQQQSGTQWVLGWVEWCLWVIIKKMPDVFLNVICSYPLSSSTDITVMNGKARLAWHSVLAIVQPHLDVEWLMSVNPSGLNISKKVLLPPHRVILKILLSWTTLIGFSTFWLSHTIPHQSKLCKLCQSKLPFHKRLSISTPGTDLICCWIWSMFDTRAPLHIMFWVMFLEMVFLW